MLCQIIITYGREFLIQDFIMVHSIKIYFNKGYMMDSQQKKYASRG